MMIQLEVGFSVSNALITELSDLQKEGSILSALGKHSSWQLFPYFSGRFWQQACTT